jgi:predicted ATPase
VLRGAACTGKTPIIELLAEKGYQTGQETARVYIDNELSADLTIEEFFGDPDTQIRIKPMQLELEEEILPADTIFLDWAMPDRIPFYRISRLNLNECWEKCKHFRYASVYILNLLPFQLNGTRIEDDTFTILLDE